MKDTEIERNAKAQKIKELTRKIYLSNVSVVIVLGLGIGLALIGARALNENLLMVGLTSVAFFFWDWIVFSVRKKIDINNVIGAMVFSVGIALALIGVGLSLDMSDENLLMIVLTVITMLLWEVLVITAGEKIYIWVVYRDGAYVIVRCIIGMEEALKALVLTVIIGVSVIAAIFGIFHTGVFSFAWFSHTGRLLEENPAMSFGGFANTVKFYWYIIASIIGCTILYLAYGTHVLDKVHRSS